MKIILNSTPCKILIIIAASMMLAQCSLEKQKIEINYLNQKPPGMEAKLFAPGIISTDFYEHSAPAFSPDGTIVLWTALDSNYKASLKEMEFKDGKWSDPHIPSFADTTADDYYPSFSPDGKKLYFSSRRKVPAGYPQRNMRIWEVDRLGDSWGQPVPFDTLVSNGSEAAHSITKNGTMYFSSFLIAHTDWSIRKSEKTNGHYSESTLLPFNINSAGGEDGPFIAPDESFLIFESMRPEGIDGSVDLYITFKNKNNQWSVPLNMGSKINSASGERFPRLSPDGKYLFFGSSRSGINDIYWIDAAIIDELRNNATTQVIIENPLGEQILSALDKENFEGASNLLKQWLNFHPDHLDAMLIYSNVLRKLNRFSDAEELLTSKISHWSKNPSFVLEMAVVKFGMNKNQEAEKLLAPILIEGVQQWTRYKQLAISTFEMGKFNISDDYFEKTMAIESDQNEYYNRACAYALIGNKDKAFALLNSAIEKGFNTKTEYEVDGDLTTLRHDVRWNELLKKLK